MTDMPLIAEKMTIDDFIRRYGEEGPFEIIDGEILIMSPTVSRHGIVMKRLVASFLKYEESHSTGEIFFEVPFVLSDSSNWVKGARVPDLMFFEASRLDIYKKQYPNWEDKPFIIVPDMVIEIISPSDSYSEIDRKVELYLEDGVQLVWVIDPQRNKIAIHSANTDHPIILSGNATLAGEEVIPGFEIKLTEIFG